MTKAEIGKSYRHYKGDEYSVITIGKHTEIDQEMVVYQQEVANDHGAIGTVWIRPKDMWESKVEFESKEVERFTLLE